MTRVRKSPPTRELSSGLIFLFLVSSFLSLGNFAHAATLTITTTSPLPNGTVETPYKTKFAATGGTSPYAWTITSGSVPGLYITSTGVLSGVPSAASSYSITVQVIDSSKPTRQVATATFNLTTNVSTNANFYVATTGNDNTGNGSLASPWQTIKHAINKVGGPGVTINVRAGTYHEHVLINKSGSASGGYFILRNYDYPSAAMINGGTVIIGSTGYAYGLVDVVGPNNNPSYITFDGFEVYNFTTTNDSFTPAGIHVEGAGTNIQLLNNYIHHIWNTGKASSHDGTCGAPSPQAFGLVVVGTVGTSPLTNVTINGNTLTDLKTGCSESLTVNGNVNGFTISHNTVHNNSNIGIDAIGGEGVASGYQQYNGSPNDQARNGEISDNTVYTIHSNSLGPNGPYGLACYCADGIYLDGSAEIIVERNTVYDVDLGIEVTGEGAAQNTTNNVVRDNLFFYNATVGISIGGQGNPGGSSNSTIIDNTTWDNGNNSNAPPMGEFATGTKLTGTNVVENNIFYASAVSGTLVQAQTTTNITLNHNLYFAPNSSENWCWNYNAGNSTCGVTYTAFASYQSGTCNLGTCQDHSSQYADPLFVNINAKPPLTLPNLNVKAGSPALSTGTILGPLSIVGPFDVTGVTPRIHVTDNTIDVGAYEQ
jgi:hypothetical protein